MLGLAVKSKREEGSGYSHPKNGDEEARLAADSVWEARAGDGGEKIRDGEKDCDYGGVYGEEATEEGHRVHHDAVYAAELLGKHNADHGDGGAAIARISKDLKKGRPTGSCLGKMKSGRVAGPIRLVVQSVSISEKTGICRV